MIRSRSLLNRVFSVRTSGELTSLLDPDCFSSLIISRVINQTYSSVCEPIDSRRSIRQAFKAKPGSNLETLLYAIYIYILQKYFFNPHKIGQGPHDWQRDDEISVRHESLSLVCVSCCCLCLPADASCRFDPAFQRAYRLIGSRAPHYIEGSLHSSVAEIIARTYIRR